MFIAWKRRAGAIPGAFWMVSIVLFAAGAPARSAEPVELSLDEALRRLDDVSEPVRIAAAALERARGEEAQVRSAYYPQFGLTAAYTRTLDSEFAALQDFGDEFADLPFGQKNRWDLGVGASQSLWSGGKIGGRVAAAQAGIRAAELGLAEARAAAALELTESYFDVALTERLVKIAEATLEQAEATLGQVRSAREVGDRSEFDLLRAQVSRDNQRPLVVQRRSARDLARLRLAQLLELPADSEIHASTDPLSLGPATFSAFVGDTEERAPLRQASAALDAQEALRRAAHGERLPSIGLSSDYGRVAYPSAGLPSWSGTRTNWTVGVGLSIPIFTGGRLRGLEMAAQADVEAARARQQQVREIGALEGEQVESLLRSAQALWEASTGTVEQASRAYEIAEIRYREGLSTQVELSDARLALEIADATRAVAARDLAVARSRVALLPNLPLGGSAAAAAAPIVDSTRSGGR